MQRSAGRAPTRAFGWGALALTVLVFLISGTPPASAQQTQSPAQRIWRLAGIYFGETAATPQYPLRTRIFVTPRAVGPQGGSADIEIVSPTRGILFRQQFVWSFAQDMRAIRSGQRHGVSFALQGDRPTTNGNSATLNGANAAPRLDQRYFPPNRRTGFTQRGVEVFGGPGLTASLDGSAPASVQGAFLIRDSNPNSGPEWAAFWFTLTNFNGEQWQFFEIHYVFVSDSVPGGTLPAVAQPLPGATFVPVSGTAPPPPPPPPQQDGRFPRPQLGGLDVDWCARWASGCGQEGADQFCRRQGYSRAAQWNRAMVNQTVVLGDNRSCQGQGACGALRDVTCVRDAGLPPTPPQAARLPLKLFWHQNRTDNFTTATAPGEQSALGTGYVFVRVEGQVFRDPQPGTVPLKLYWNAARNDNFTTASAQGEAAARSNGYVFIRNEGYIYPTQQPGTVPLRTYWHAARADNFATATPIGERSAKDFGYVFAWVEGYVFPP